MLREKVLISPSEALLLGLCWGEYCQLQGVSEEATYQHFGDVLEERLLPFIPTMVTESKANASNLPDDIDWANDGHFGLTGRSVSHPGRMFLKSRNSSAADSHEANAKIEEIQWDFSRRSLLDLLFLGLWESLALTNRQRYRYGPSPKERCGVKFDPVSDAPKQGVEERFTIERVVREIITNNNLEEVFDAGMAFGQLLCVANRRRDEGNGSTTSTLTKSDSGSNLIELIIRADIEYRRLHKSVLELPILRHCRHATTLLTQITELEGARRRDHNEDMVMVVWLAYGEVLGLLRDADENFRMKDATTAIPRSFAIGPNDSPDEIMRRLIKIEGEFNADQDPIPEDVVVRLSPLIEALTRRMWPMECRLLGRTGQYEVTLATVLRDKRHSPNPIHQRFGSIAYTLHTSYRNPALHNALSFRCSFEEARFFLGGIRTMVELWKQNGTV